MTVAREFFARIDRRQKALASPGKKISDRKTSIRAGFGPDLLNGIRKQFRAGKQNGVRYETIEKLAAALETTPQWLLHGEGAETAVAGAHLDSADILGFAEADLAFGDAGGPVPLIGYVRAGAEAVYLPLHEDVLDRVAAPPNATEHTRALEIRGDSLGALFDRWLVYFNDEQRPISPDLVNKLCIVKLDDGRVLVKKIRRGRDGGFELLSNTEPPIQGAKIVWAAKVIDMRPQ